MIIISRRGFLGKAGLGTAALSFLQGVFPGASAGSSSRHGSAGTDKAVVSFRIGVPQWFSEARFQGLMALFEANKDLADEITFFTSETHPPLPLEVIEHRAGILKSRMAEARVQGYRAGVNILATLGHHEENLTYSLGTDFTRMTDIHGGVCQGSFCPNGEGMRAYIAGIYRSVALAEPDYIWVDDDVRLFGHMPIRCGCFCDGCMALFNEAAGASYNRETLRTAFHQPDLGAKMAVRQAWLRHNRQTMIRLLSWIEETVHAVKPGLPLGFMTGERFYEGFDLDGWAKALSGPGNAEVLWRPGGGNYTDEWLDGIAQKAHQIGRQIALLPASVVSIQSEIESFPYQRLRKSQHATALEAAAYIAGGCTGAAFNVLSMYDEPLDEYAPLLQQLRAARPFLDTLAGALGRAPISGVHTGWNKNSFAAANTEGDWFDGPRCDPGGGFADALYTLGIPPAYDAVHARAVVLSGDAPLAFGEEEIQNVFKGGVYLDGGALARLNEMGYGNLTGFSVERLMDRDCIEEFLEHPLNAGFARRRRDGRQSFWHSPAHSFAFSAPDCQPLARVINYAGEETAPCCLGVFENELGGRVCVAGYYPWVQLHSGSKSAQIKAIMRWLSRDTLPAYVSSFHRINVWPRVHADGTTALALLNASLDPAESVEVCVLTAQERLRMVDMDCGQTDVFASSQDGPYRRFIVPEMKPWSMQLAVTA